MTKGVNEPVKKKKKVMMKNKQSESLFKGTTTSSGTIGGKGNKLQPMFGSGLRRVHDIVASLLGGSQSDSKAANEVIDGLASTDAANCLDRLSLGNGETRYSTPDHLLALWDHQELKAQKIEKI
eukprot:CAMPEP_0185282192 /NCGR_PEP_ID=MMETSP1359-20130426/67136_1 /TAXON_ID=552665 /ORGANISM="Bigelowiella longifila, Strain CCMP242" /LENGTH=123 /DNA_ID=CAMNT_0027877707 /DNA_START=85 /DNA_END=456 /DNA_ORIENTATION=-